MICYFKASLGYRVSSKLALSLRQPCLKIKRKERAREYGFAVWCFPVVQETLDIQQLAGTHTHTHTLTSRGGDRDGEKALKSKANCQSLVSATEARKLLFAGLFSKEGSLHLIKPRLFGPLHASVF